MSSNNQQNSQCGDAKGTSIPRDSHKNEVNSRSLSQDDHSEKCPAPGISSDSGGNKTSQSHEADAGSKEISGPEPSSLFRKQEMNEGGDAQKDTVESTERKPEEAEGQSKIGSNRLHTANDTAHNSRPTNLSGLDINQHEANLTTGSTSGYSHQKKMEVLDSKSIAQCSNYKSLADMDNKSGVLHVWFLLLDGLVSSVNRCPKAVQSHTLNTLINLLKSASNVPGELAMGFL